MTEGRRGAHSIQRRGDVLVRPSRAHLTNELLDLGRVAPRVLAWLGLADAKLRVLPATPVDDEHDLSARVFDVHDDLLDQRAYQPLLDAHVDGGGAPSRFEVRRQGCKVRTLDLRTGVLFLRQEARLARPQAFEGRVPSCFEFRSDKAIVGVDGGIPPLSDSHVVTSLLALEFEGLSSLVPPLFVLSLRHDDSFHRGWLHGNEDLTRDGVVGSAGAEGDAGLEAVHRVADAAGVAQQAAPAVGHAQHAPAPAASQQAR